MVKKLVLILFIQPPILSRILYLAIHGRCKCDITREVFIPNISNDRLLSPPTRGEWATADYVAQRLLAEFPDVGYKVYFADSSHEPLWFMK